MPPRVSPLTVPAGAWTTGRSPSAAIGTNAPAATRAAPARSPPVARLSLWIGIIASRLQIISQPDADRAWPERAVAAGEEGLRMDIGDRMIVEQVFDISGRDRKSTRLNSSH